MKKTMKKTLSIVSVILSVLLLIGAFGVFSFADEPIAEQEITLTKEDVDAIVFTEDSVTTFECVFRSDLPEIPYVNVLDYLETIYTDAFTVEDNGDGVYTVVNAYEETMVIDTVNDTICFESFDAFCNCVVNAEGSTVDLDFGKFVEGDYIVEPEAITLDLAAYGIDIIALDGNVYLPLTIISTMFAWTYNNAVYFDGAICFNHTFDPDNYFDEVDQSPLYEETERTPEMARFTYNSLCFIFDFFYGKPANTDLAYYLEEMTFDEALDACDEYTQLAKELLLSESKVDYFSGLAILAYYLHDGGHTCLSNILVNGMNYYFGMPLVSDWYNVIMGDSEIAEAVWDCLNPVFDDFNYASELSQLRTEIYAEDYSEEIAGEWESGAFLIIHGDTAVFVFDSFDEDTPYDLKEALDTAKDAGVKNFIIDDSCNGGGYVISCNYIVTLITNAKYHSRMYDNYDFNPLTGATLKYTYEFDLNLDGEFNEEDDAFCYDFNFAIVTSYGAFSCGNKLPIEAQARGIVILGETSGGGSCNCSERYTADGFAFPISDISKNYLPDGNDYDLGAEPDYELVNFDEDDGYWHYGQMYDIDNVSAIVTDHYTANPYVDTGIDPLPVILLVVSLFGIAALVVIKRRRSVTD